MTVYIVKKPCKSLKSSGLQSLFLVIRCDIVILLPKQNKWDSFIKAIDMFSDDFMADGRTTDIVQERDEL